jgi:4-amino-4-deoxy-L-arabinose transferase-like glycosyltransferase
MEKRKGVQFLFFLWLILAVALLWTCNIPKEIDFERYMSISEYIFTHKEYLLLHFDGHIYTDKPPLMFWLIAAGWKVFGMHVWWPYLVLCLFSGASVFMTYQIAEILYEKDNDSTRKAFKSALFLLTLTFFGMATCELRVDTFLLFCALCVHYGCLKCSGLKVHRLGGIAVFSGIALGLFFKGPIIFVVGLLPALLGLWAAKRKILLKPILFSVLLGLIPILCWLIPACIQGGPLYQHDVLFGQIANRSTQTGSPLYFYLQRLPGYLFPFVLFPSVWTGIYNSICYFRTTHPVNRYCLIGIFILMLIFSLFGQKAMHYLLPTMPLWAIFLVNIVKFDAIEVLVSKVFLWIFAFFGVFLCFLKTGIGLHYLGCFLQYTTNYSIYLVVQSFQVWQAVSFFIFSLIALIGLYAKPLDAGKTLFAIIVFLSLLLQINIQILNEHYFHKRFYIYFKEKVTQVQQTGNKFQLMLSEKDNQMYCSPLLPKDILPLTVKPEESPKYLISNQRCLFYNARRWHANPQAVFVPQIYCAFGIWEMNENTKKLMENCAEK